MKLYDVLNPEGRTIAGDEVYASIEEATAAFEQWAEQYRPRGYYGWTSPIPFSLLHHFCTIAEMLRGDDGRPHYTGVHLKIKLSSKNSYL